MTRAYTIDYQLYQVLDHSNYLQLKWHYIGRVDMFRAAVFSVEFASTKFNENTTATMLHYRPI